MDEIDNTTPRVSGKQVLLDAATLFKDVGIFIYDVSKIAIVKIKSAFKTDDKPADATAINDEANKPLDISVVAQAS